MIRMNLKPSIGLLAGLLAGLLPSCSIKEDRGECPCWLQVYAGDAGALAPVLTLSLWNGDELCRETVPTEASLVLDRAVPKGAVTVSAHTPLHRMRREGSLLLIPDGSECDSLFAHHGVVSCGGEAARDTVRLRAQFAVVNIAVVNLEPGVAYPYDLVVRSTVDGYDLLGGSPHAGSHSLPLRPVSEGVYRFRVPRQADGSMMLDLLMGGTLIDSLPIGEHLVRAGYDWTAPELPEIRIEVDYGRSEPHIVIEPWLDGAVYDEVI